MGDLAGQRCEGRLLGRLAGQRERAHGAAVEPALGGHEFVRPVSLVILNAASLASAPELPKNTRAAVDAEKSDQRFGQRDPGSVAYRFDM